VPVVLAFEIFL